ncbi:MAG TPA: ABC transporter permease [Bryobacteraceae bacterium]|nr:ABC transporter permease [Bryobacteraceae bacterium]
MNILRQDLAHAFRVLVKKPTFSFIAILTLAIGIGANSTMFSLINGVLLKPLPYPHPERLVNLWTSYPASHDQPDIFSPPNYFDVAARTRTFESVGAYDNVVFTLASDGPPESITGLLMSASMTRVLGIRPQLGRWFTSQEDDGSVPVVVLSDALWRNRFGADSQILGRTLMLNEKAYQVVGVLPPDTGFPVLSTSLYAPISFSPSLRTSRGSVEINVAARMRPGVALPTAVAELRTIAAALAQAYPAVDSGIHMGAVPLQESLVGNVRGLLVVLWAAVGFMLAVACANVANLLLTQSIGRQREFAVRRSLGASNRRLVRQLLTESLLLALLGGVAGLAIAGWAMPLIMAHLPKGFPQLHQVRLDPAVLLFTLFISLLNGLLFSLAPTLGSARRNLAAALRESGGRTGSSIVHRRLGRALVACEVAVVMLLLIGAGLVLRSLARLSAVDPGFRANGLIVWQLPLPATRYGDASSRRVFYRNVVDQVRSLPGVTSAAFVNPLPFGPVDITLDGGFRIAGRPDPAPGQFPQALFTRVSPRYFATMQIPLERGREFTDQDSETSVPVTIISETLARSYFPGQDPVGQHLILGRQNPIQLEIVGVVGDVKHNNLRADIRPELYIPIVRFTSGFAGLVVRGPGPIGSLLSDVQRRVWTVENGLAANLCAPAESLLHASLAPARIASVLLSIFAATTLALGLIGIYGVFSYAVSQRTREIGIRMSLGAAPGDVLRMVLGEALGLAVVGMAIGVAGAALLSRYIATLLFGVAPTDLGTYLLAALGVITAALLAACTPTRRAMRIDPASCLRSE